MIRSPFGARFCSVVLVVPSAFRPPEPQLQAAAVVGVVVQRRTHVDRLDGVGRVDPVAVKAK